MFYILSKALIFLLRPLIWVAGLLLLSAFLKSARWRKRAFWVAIGVLWLFGNNALLGKVAGWYETPPPLPLEQHFHTAIVLGGYLGTAPAENSALFDWHESADRVAHAHRLYREGKVDRLLVTGGASSILVDRQPEAVRVAAYLMALGVPADDLLIDSLARNTRENALNAKKLLGEQTDSLLLVTSASHMPRAHACFRAVGLAPASYSVDFIQPFEPLRPSDYLLPSTSALKGWERLIKEWVGNWVYRWRGWA